MADRCARARELAPAPEPFWSGAGAGAKFKDMRIHATRGPAYRAEDAPSGSPDRSTVLALITLVLPILQACGPNHHLAEHDFRDATVAMITVPAPRPEVFSDLDLRVDPTDLLGTAIRVGTGLAREATLDDFRARADSAARNVRVPERIGDRTLEGALRYLRGIPPEGDRRADFEFELRIVNYGFVADSWSSGARLELQGDLLLLDGATGRIVWSTHVTATNPIRSTSVRANSSSVANVATAITLHEMTREEIEEEMRVLADVAADALVRQLGEDLDEAREG